MEELRGAVADAHTLFAEAMLVQGSVVISCAKVAGWTIKRAGAINQSLAKEARHD